MPERKGVPTVFDPSYKGVGQKVGLEIWRVEKLKVIKKPPTDDCYQGKLYSGDSYIILQTKMRGNAMERHIFFWLGAESSQDEMGVAAYKTVELDESLGGEPVQHREVQGHETDEFLKLFKSGVRYMEGGVATGFKHVDPDAFPTELLHIKGSRNIRALKVPVKVDSLNHGDSFILDKGRNIYVWSGKEASRSEKVTAVQVANAIRDNDRSGKATVHMCEGKDEDKFFTEGGFDKKRVKDSAAGGADDAHSRAVLANLELVRVSDASGSMEMTPITEKPYKQDHLDTNDVFILYAGPGQELYVWVGKGASKEERAFAVQSGVDYLTKKGLPNHTPVTRIREGYETAQFKAFFGAWKEPKRDVGSSKSNFKKLQFNASTLHDKREAQKATLPDDGSGKLEVWRIEDFEMAEWPKEKYGHFYGGDSYVMLYTYLKNNKEEYIIYFWQGLKSSQDEKGASAIHAVNLDDKYGGAPVQVRVVQNKEPPHFLLVMKKYGGLVVHEGGRASGFKNVEDTDKYDLDGTRLFHVRGTNDWNTRAVQVPEETTSLNSGDVFVLDCPTGVYLWFGKASTGDEREYAKTMAPRVKTGKGEIHTVFEGDEPKEFWAALGWTSDSRPEYTAVKVDEEDEYREPRLFQCSNARGYFYVEEVFDFDQEDLIEDDVMLLDTYYELFVWVGKNANVEEKKKSLDTAVEFVKTDPSGRTIDDVCIMRITQGNEPSNFKCHFLAWDDEKWAKMAAAAGDAGPMDIAAAQAMYSTDTKYSLEQLVNNDIPEHVDRTKKEDYLTDADFEKALGMNRAEYDKLPGWKKNNAKKKAGLF